MLYRLNSKKCLKQHCMYLYCNIDLGGLGGFLGEKDGSKADVNDGHLSTPV